jgi:hypothetical protein
VEAELLNDILNPFAHTAVGSAWGWAVFAVEWLRRGVQVEREVSASANPGDVQGGRGPRHPRDEPDSFRLIDDATGAIVISVKISERRRP